MNIIFIYNYLNLTHILINFLNFLIDNSTSRCVSPNLSEGASSQVGICNVPKQRGRPTNTG